MFSWLSRKNPTQHENHDKNTEKCYIKKAYEENYGFWMVHGGFYPVLGIETCLYIPAAVLLTITFSTTPFCISKSEIAIKSETVHFAVFLAIELTAMIVFMYHRKTIDEIYLAMGQRFYDYENTLDEECYEVIASAYRAGRSRKKIFHDLFVGCSMSTLLTAVIVRPLISYFKGDPDPNDGILRLLPVPTWTPFKTKSWYVTLIFFLAEDIVAYVTPGIVFGCILFIVCASEDVGAQLIILGHTLKSVVRRAEGLNLPKDEALKLCFNHSIKHHQMLLKFIKSLEMILNIPGFVLLFGSTILMCMSGFIFVSKEVPFISKIEFFLFLLSEMTIIFLICWCGEFIQKTSNQICDMVYFSEWPDNMESMKSYILIIQLRSIKSIKLNLGGFMVASLETFGHICSSAFSYFNLMLAVN
nr:odorant receptor 28 [Graphosoma rubrolineatum]